MHYFITLLIFFVLVPITSAQNKIQGRLTKVSLGVVEKKPVKLHYIFDGEALRFTHTGCILNAGAESTTAEYSKQDGIITLKVKENYGRFGPADGLMSAMVTYNLVGKLGEAFKITIDDSGTEGGGGSHTFSFVIKKTEDVVIVSPDKK